MCKTENLQQNHLYGRLIEANKNPAQNLMWAKRALNAQCKKDVSLLTVLEVWRMKPEVGRVWGGEGLPWDIIPLKKVAIMSH